MSATEQVEGVARSAIDALKGNPACLTAVLFAALMAVLTYFALTTQQEHDKALDLRQMDLLQSCYEWKKIGVPP